MTLKSYTDIFEDALKMVNSLIQHLGPPSSKGEPMKFTIRKRSRKKIDSRTAIKRVIGHNLGIGVTTNPKGTGCISIPILVLLLLILSEFMELF